MKIALDWSYKDDKTAIYNGKKLSKRLPKLCATDVVYTENIPAKIARPLLDSGVCIMRCKPNHSASFRERLNLEKTDEIDAMLLWEMSELQPELFREWKGDPVLTTLYRSFKEIQKARIRQSNRVFAKEEPVAIEILKDLEATERRIVKAMKKELDAFPVWEWLQQIKGVGVSTASGLIATIAKYGISNINQVSSLWHLFGLHVVNGKAPRLTSGEQITYIPEAKTLVLGVLSDSFIKQRSPVYRDIYDREKERQLSIIYPESELAAKFNGYKKDDVHLSKNHAHRRAIRKMMKVFMQHLWVAWRKIEGCETRPLYAHEYLHHEHYIEPPVPFIEPKDS